MLGLSPIGKIPDKRWQASPYCLTDYIGTISADKMEEMNAAIRIALATE